MAFTIIYDKPSEPTVYLGTDDDLELTDEQLNAALPGAAAGTLITSPGYASMKQKDLDDSWVSL